MSSNPESKERIFAAIAENAAPPQSWYCWRGWLDEADGTGPRRFRIAADSKYWLWVNGTLVVREGGLKRGPAPGATYADVLDLGPWLTAGPNLLAVQQWYFGRDGFSHADSGAPAFYCESLDPGCRVDRFELARDPAFFDAGYVRPGAPEGYRLAEGSVGFDARRSLGDWQQPDYRGTAFAPATADLAAVRATLGGLHDRPIPPFAWGERTACPLPEPVAEPTGHLRYALPLPANLQFCPYLVLRSAPGLKLQWFSDAPTHALATEYITTEGRQEWESPAWLNGETLWLRVPDRVELLEAGYRETAYPCTVTGHFESSDAALDEIWARSVRTLHVTMRDSFMDCPCRERAQWWGDEVIQLGQIPYCLSGEAQALVRKGIRELVHWQRPDHTLYAPVPSGNWHREIPLQMLASIGPYGLETYYQHTGDLETLREAFPAVKRYLGLWQWTGDPLDARRPGDWGDGIDLEVLSAGWLTLAWEGAAALASRLGETDTARQWIEWAGQLRTRAARAFGVEGGFRGPSHPGPLDDRANAMAVLAGMAAEADAPAVAATLLANRTASPYMEKYVLEALFVLGRAEDALRRLRERYQPMLDIPGSTLWERFPETGFFENTYNHSWSGGPLILLARHVAGLAPAEPGWQRIRFAPQPGDLEAFRFHCVSPVGEISASYRRHSSGFQFQLTVPEGVRCDYVLSNMGSFESVCLAEAGMGTRPAAATGMISGGESILSGVYETESGAIAANR